jgi:polyphosphate kinase 2 (PPK2 family)
MLAEEGTTVVKCFLHISREEQAERLRARLEEPDKHWKFSSADLAERRHWDRYQEVYQDAIAATSTGHAPWYVVPADRKWYRNLAVASILVRTLERLDMSYPPAEEGLTDIVVE